jgi:four helix bundle protein
MIKSFTDMDVWRILHHLSYQVFELSGRLPKSEDYGLTSQIRRSANSVSANIAEGFGRNTKKDKRHYYITARGSAFETQNHLLYGCKIGYFNQSDARKIYIGYQKLIHQLNKLLKSLK